MKNYSSAIAGLNAIAARELGGVEARRPVRHTPPDLLRWYRKVRWLKKYRREHNDCGLVEAMTAWTEAHT